MGAEMDEARVDVGEAIRRATTAARRGDIDALETELARLKDIGSEQVGTLAITLRRLAACVRAHPSFGRRPAQAS